MVKFEFESKDYCIYPHYPADHVYQAVCWTKVGHAATAFSSGFIIFLISPAAFL